MYVYIRSEPNLWTVGFYSPDGKWHAESDHDTPQRAAGQVAYLNGSETAKVDHLNQLCDILLAYANGSITRAEMEAAIKNR